MIILANIILATQIPYIMVAMLCLVVLPIEVTAFYYLMNRRIHLFKSLSVVTLGNIISTATGFFLIPFVPTPLGFQTHESLSVYLLGTALGFLMALLLSWAIEAYVAKRMLRTDEIQGLWRAIGWCNVVSYAVLFAILFMNS